MLSILFLYCLYGSIFVIGKYAIGIAQPIFLTGVRMTFAGIISCAIHYAWYKTPQFSKLHKKDWLVLVLLALFNVYITNAGEFWSLQYLSAGKTSFIYNISPFMVLVFSAILFSEVIALQKVIGMVIGFCSLMPMLLGDTTVADTTRHFGPISVAEIVMICAAMATSLGWVIMRHFMKKGDFTPYFINGMSLFLGGLMCLAHSFFFETRPLMTDTYSNFLWYMSLMMFIQNIGAYNLHSYLLRYYSATLIALFSFIMPLITVLLGYLFLSEPITYEFFICSAGVALGLCIFYVDELKIMYKDEKF